MGAGLLVDGEDADEAGHDDEEGGPEGANSGRGQSDKRRNRKRKLHACNYGRPESGYM